MTKARDIAGQLPLVSGSNLQSLAGSSILNSGDFLVKKPLNVFPSNQSTVASETPALTGDAYKNIYQTVQTAAQFQLSLNSNFSTILHDSQVIAATTNYTLPSGILQFTTNYYWRVRYRTENDIWSNWSEPTGFITAATFNSYIATPTATPANFGDALEGGFYAGMIWGELTQSATSTVIGTGTKVFTVPSMTSVPIVYAGQQLEVRSRANPANRMIGTVTGAIGTTLTINVTSVTGSGTFTDWSVMARHRLIVAPKASGENAAITLKNANTALPTACQTLNEGMRATQAMRDADTSTVYPAAHWARNLNINSRTDWYIPARDELELCWRNLKPTTTGNYTTADRPTGQSFNYANNGAFGDTANTHGLNNNSAPVGAAYTSGVPAQVVATTFRTGGAEAFEFGSAYYWSSTDYDAASAWTQYWLSSGPGYQGTYGKTSTARVRAVRRSII